MKIELLSQWKLEAEFCNTQTRLEEVLPILDSLHLLGGELEALGGLEDQHNRRTKAKLANLMK